MTAVVNVNLSAGDAVLIPCPIRRSVTFSVRLGECDKACEQYDESARPECGHWTGCGARPIRVSCSISGATWEESEVVEVDASRGPDGFRVQFREDAAIAACRARWALVKALVLGRGHTLAEIVSEPLSTAHYNGMLGTRNAVFAALADMARAERAEHAAFLALPIEIRCSSIIAKAQGHVATDPTTARWPSATILEHYVEHLIEQVGTLEGT